MRKFSTKRKMKKILSWIFLAVFLVSTAGNSLMTQAEDVTYIYPGNVPTLTAGKLTVPKSDCAEDVYDSNGVCQGIKVTYPTLDGYYNQRIRTKDSEYSYCNLKDGFRLEITDIKKVSDGNDSYSIAIGLGFNNVNNNGDLNYNKPCYLFVCGYSGNFAIVRSEGNLETQKTDVFKGTLGKKLSEIDKLTLDVKAITTYEADGTTTKKVDWEFSLNDGMIKGMIENVYTVEEGAYGANITVGRARSCGMFISVYSDFEPTEENYLNGLSYYGGTQGVAAGVPARDSDISLVLSKLYNGYATFCLAM